MTLWLLISELFTHSCTTLNWQHVGSNAFYLLLNNGNTQSNRNVLYTGVWVDLLSCQQELMSLVLRAVLRACWTCCWSQEKRSTGGPGGRAGGGQRPSQPSHHLRTLFLRWCFVMWIWWVLALFCYLPCHISWCPVLHGDSWWQLFNGWPQPLYGWGPPDHRNLPAC